MSENMYSMLKRRWPILKNIHHHMRLAQKAIKVCCILENICRDWNEQLPPDDDDEEPNVPNSIAPAAVGNQLTLGKAARLQLLELMEP